jgi:hypothetical protein
MLLAHTFLARSTISNRVHQLKLWQFNVPTVDSPLLSALVQAIRNILIDAYDHVRFVRTQAQNGKRPG